MPPRFRPHASLAALKTQTPVQQHDERRGTAYSRGYDRWWARQRRAHLRQSPLCVCCDANGFIRPASLVDHIVPHRGDQQLFRDQTNWQSLCAECHGRIKSVIERLWDAGRVSVSALRLDRRMPEYFESSLVGAGVHSHPRGE